MPRFSDFEFPKDGGSTEKTCAEWLADLDDIVGDTLSLTKTNPTLGSGASDLRGAMITITYDNDGLANSDPSFSNETGLAVIMNSNAGQNNYSAGGGANQTLAKKTLVPLAIAHTAKAAGQRFVSTQNGTYLGMGDAFLESRVISFAGANIAGDEGAGWSSVNYCHQQNTRTLASIVSIPTQATINTTITQAVTASKNVQTVTVASTAGVAVDQWVVIGQEVAKGLINIEAVKVTAVGVGTISGRFVCNHGSGTTVTPALVLELNNGAMGEQRLLVNLSATPYTTGTVSSIVGGGFVGSGTSWAANVVGGTATNIGAIALTADDYSGSPFNGSGVSGTLKSWFAITSVADTTHMGIHTYSTAGDEGYNGIGVGGSGVYTIRPSARILKVLNTEMICETSAHTWTAGDDVELAIAPYPDVTGFQYALAAYTPPGAYRGFMDVTNRGARKFDFAFQIRGLMAAGGNAETVAFDNGIALSEVNTGILITAPKVRAIGITGSVDTEARIEWFGSWGGWLGPNTSNLGMDIQGVYSGAGGKLSFISDSILSEPLSKMTFTGSSTWTGYGKCGSYAVAGVPSASTAGAGAFIYVTNGNAGAACLAVSNGTDWKVVALGATISAS